MLRVGVLGCALALAARGAHAGNIDTGGFAMDSVTTYCQGITPGASGPFANLESNSINRCSVVVNLTPAATTVHKNDPLEVKFKAAANFGEVKDDIFPTAVNKQAKTAKPVVSSYIKACKAGTNGAPVIDGTPVGSEADTGAFDANGRKALRATRFTFADPGDYIIFGQVTLDGEAALKVSGMQFLTFQKIKVVDTGVAIAPSPAPTPSPDPGSTTAANTTTPGPSATTNSSLGFDSIKNGSKAAEADNESGAGTVKSGMDKPLSTSTPAPDDTTASNKSAAESSSSTGTLLGVIAGVCVVVAAVGFVIIRRKKDNGSADKPSRPPTQTFHMSRSEQMDDPEPVEYIANKSVRNSNHPNTHQSGLNQSVPILGGPASTSSTDDLPINISKRGSDMRTSFEEMDSNYEEGTVTASNKAISTQSQMFTSQKQQTPPKAAVAPDSPARETDARMVSSIYDDDDRGTAVYQGRKSSLRQSEDEHEFYQSDWEPSATAQPRDVSTVSFTERETDAKSRADGFGAMSFISDTMEDEYEQGRVSRLNSEASVDSYAFRPSRVSVAESYQSRVSRYSYDSEFDRESSRISGMSLYSDRGTNV